MVGASCFTHMESGFGASSQARRSKSHPSPFSSSCLCFLFYELRMNSRAFSSAAGGRTEFSQVASIESML